MNYRRIIPNSISALSLTFGVLSIFDTFEGNFSRAAIFIILAVIADSMDGRAARFFGGGGGGWAVAAGAGAERQTGYL